MIKLTALLTKTSSLSDEAFIETYEERHAPLIVSLIPYFERYRRSYLANPSILAHIPSPTPPSLPFHSITEMWYRDDQAISRQISALEGRAGELVAQDETTLFDRARLGMFATRECVTPPMALKPRPQGIAGDPPIKFSGLLRKKQGLTQSEFETYYERNHAKLATKVVSKDGTSLFANYSRSYPILDQVYSIGEAPGLEIDFDVITDMWFWSQDDADEMARLCQTPEAAELLAADEAEFLDRSSMRSFTMVEHTTDPAMISRSLEEITNPS